MSSSAMTHDIVISDELMQSTLIFSFASAANMRPDRPGVAARREPMIAMVATPFSTVPSFASPFCFHSATSLRAASANSSSMMNVMPAR